MKPVDRNVLSPEPRCAEEGLPVAEERFRSLTSLSSDFYWETDEQHRLCWVESGQNHRLLLNRDVHLGKTRWEIPAVAPDGAGWDAHRQMLDAQRPFRNFEFARRADDGEIRHFAISGEPVFDAERRFRGYRGVGREISAQKRFEEHLLRLSRRYAFVSAVNETILRAESPEALLDRVCEITIGHREFASATVFMVEPGTPWLKTGAVKGKMTSFIRAARVSIDGTIPEGRGLSGLAIQTGAPAVTNDYQTDPRLEPWWELARAYNIHSAAALPLARAGRTFGALALHAEEREAFDDETLMLLAGLAENVSVALDNFERDAERERAERRVRESEERFRRLTALSSDWYWEQDEEHRFTLTSGNLPFAREALLGKRRWEMDAVPVSGDWSEHRATLEARAPFRDFQDYFELPGGERRYVSVDGEPMFDEQQRFRGYRGIARDITAAKRAEQLLRLEHSVARSLAEAGDSAAALRAAIRAVCESESWECGRYFRVDEQAGLLRFGGGWSIPEAVVEQFIERSRELVFAPGVGLAGLVWQSGEPLWVADLTNDPRALRAAFTPDLGIRGALVFPIASEGNTIGVLAFSTRQIREPDERLLQAIGVIGSQIGQFLQRKQAEEVLRDSEERFRRLTALSSDWYWEQDEHFRFTLTSGHRFVSPEALLGKCRWETSTMPGSGDWSEHRATLEAHQRFHDFQTFRDLPGGERRYYSVDGEPIHDAQQRFRGYRGLVRDITAAKRAEQLLRLEHSVARSLAEAGDSAAAMQAVIRAVCETEGWECGRYFRADDQAGVLRFGGSWSVPGTAIDQFIERSRAVCYAPGVGLAGRVWQSGEPLWVADIGKDGRVAQLALARETGMRGAFVFPVISEGRSLGVLAFNSREVREPEERLLQAIRVIGSQIGQFLQRKQAEERLVAHLTHQQLVAELGRRALSRKDLSALLDDAVRLLAQGLRVEYAALYELAPDAATLVLRAGTDGVAAAGEQTLPAGECTPVGMALATAAPTVTGNLEQDSQLVAPTTPWAHGLKSWVSVAIRGDARPWGVLAVASPQQAAFGNEAEAFVEAAASVLSSALLRHQSEARLAYLAQFDALTGLPNRTLVRDRLEHTMAQARRKQWLVGVLFVDLDRFKLVNDTLGHQYGDWLLAEVGKRLVGCVRDGDTVGRFSGDEFVVVLADLARADDAGLVTQKIIDALSRAFVIEGQEAYVSASVGVALFPNDAEDAESLLRDADAAMYRAKESGRNSYCFFTPEMNSRSRLRLQMQAELRRALERGELLLVYQPKIDLATGRMCGLEALLRWQHPERGLVLPGEFIPVLEETGLIVAAGEWVIQAACAQIRAWRDAGFKPVSIAVNVSARQFQLKDLDARVIALVRAADVDPSLLEIEITESYLAPDPRHAIRLFDNLRRVGIRVSIDDFGTGYSSLAYLTRFPVSSLKIDRQFVRDATTDPSDAAIVRAVIDMAHNLGFVVVAEGVETEDQAAFLRRHRCDQAQGFYFAKPALPEEVEQWLAPQKSSAGKSPADRPPPRRRRATTRRRPARAS